MTEILIHKGISDDDEYYKVNTYKLENYDVQNHRQSIYGV